MDNNKDEALRCISIAKVEIVAGNWERALKLIGIASRLNKDLQVDQLIKACEKLKSTSPATGKSAYANGASSSRNDEALNREVDKAGKKLAQLILKININDCYYEILGLEKSCSIEEIRKAYKKLSLKVHPDKSSASGSEEAFKKVCRAFKCLSDESSRGQYDRAGATDGHVRRRRPQPQPQPQPQDSFDDDAGDFDPEKIFREFFEKMDIYGSSNKFSNCWGAKVRGDHQDTGDNNMLLRRIILFLLIILVAYHLIARNTQEDEDFYDYEPDW